MITMNLDDCLPVHRGLNPPASFFPSTSFVSGDQTHSKGAARKRLLWLDIKIDNGRDDQVRARHSPGTDDA
jgi:hypothetical protein